MSEERAPEAGQHVFVAVDIGCIECSESSSVIGVFTRREDAEASAKRAEEDQAQNWTGQHAFFVQEIVVDAPRDTDDEHS